MHFYHYTRFNAIKDIFGEREGENGLLPRRWIGLEPDPTTPPAFFGLLEPIPKVWTDNVSFPHTWPSLLNDLVWVHDGGILMEVTVAPSNNKVYVAERGHLEGYLYPPDAEIPKEFQHSDVKSANKAYMESMVPLVQYQAQEGEGYGYSVPLVVCTSRIPPADISVSLTQPLLEYQLKNRRPEGKNELVRLINNSPAKEKLLPWKSGYELAHGPLEVGKPRREFLF